MVGSKRSAVYERVRALRRAGRLPATHGSYDGRGMGSRGQQHCSTTALAPTLPAMRHCQASHILQSPACLAPYGDGGATSERGVLQSLPVLPAPLHTVRTIDARIDTVHRSVQQQTLTCMQQPPALDRSPDIHTLSTHARPSQGSTPTQLLTLHSTYYCTAAACTVLYYAAALLCRSRSTAPLHSHSQLSFISLPAPAT